MNSGFSQKCNKKCWVKVGIITKATGWNKETLRQARDNKIISWRESSEDGREYDLYSIPDVFYLKNEKPQ